MKRIVRFLGSLVLMCAVAAAGTAAWFWNTTYHDRALPANEAHVIVERGSSFSEVARQLAAEGVVGNVLAFRMLARMRGEETAVHAGEYRVVLPDGQPLPPGTQVTGRGPLLHFLTGTDWYQLDIDGIPR